MWSEILGVAGSTALLGYATFQLGKWSVRYDYRKTREELGDTIKELYKEQDVHKELIAESQEHIKKLDTHFLNSYN